MRTSVQFLVQQEEGRAENGGLGATQAAGRAGPVESRGSTGQGKRGPHPGTRVQEAPVSPDRARARGDCPRRREEQGKQGDTGLADPGRLCRTHVQGQGVGTAKKVAEGPHRGPAEGAGESRRQCRTGGGEIGPSEHVQLGAEVRSDNGVTGKGS